MVFVIALALPEWALAWSVRQWYMSRELLKALKANRKEMLGKFRDRKPYESMEVSTTSGLAWSRAEREQPYGTGMFLPSVSASAPC